VRASLVDALEITPKILAGVDERRPYIVCLS
jgi:hypothetical protein